MAKYNAKKKSKRQPARLRYKIQKKIREHNRKVKKEIKKNPKSKKQKLIKVPTICPFKESILQEVAEIKAKKEEERKQTREAAKLAKAERKQKTADDGLEGLVANAETRGKIHEAFQPAETPDTDGSSTGKNKENSLKTYYKEFRKVIEAADVILEVLDARDPLGTRCTQVEQAVHGSAGNKRLVLVLNKADLVPREVLDKWLKYLRKSLPAVAFKASTQTQGNRLGQRKMGGRGRHKPLMGATSVGAELVMSLLGNYCRNKEIKTSIRVGIVGLPNVGKSSIINSLKRSRACSVGATPGVTKTMQEVQLDSKIKLLDSPGVVFASSINKSSDDAVALKNAVKIGSLEDPFTAATAILQRLNKEQIMKMYNMPEFSTPQEFYAVRAARMGRFKKGGVPDPEAAARALLQDWNNGKIKYYTLPPEDDPSAIHLSSKIITEIGKEFDLDNFETMEVDVMRKLNTENIKTDNCTLLESSGPVTIKETVEKMDDDTQDNLISNKINIETNAQKKTKKSKEDKTTKIEPESKLEGNQSLNKLRKAQFKRDKKSNIRKEKVAMALSTDLGNITLSTGSNNDDYDFDTDFPIAE